MMADQNSDATNGSSNHALYMVHEHRINRVEEQVSDLGKTVTKIESDLRYGNRLTEQIKSDTAEMVTITKSMQLIGKALGAIVLVAAAIGAIGVLQEWLK